MNKQEISKILTIIKSTYPALPKIPNIDATVSAWYSLLRDIDYSLAEKSLAVVLSSQTIPAWPTPGAIRKAAIDLSCRIPSEDEVLFEIMERLTNRYKEHKLSAIAQKVGDSLGWSYMGMSEEPGVLRGQIRGLYRSCVERFKQDVLMVPIGKGEILKELTGGQLRVKELTAGIGRHDGAEDD